MPTSSDYNTFKTVFFYCVMILLMPVGAFFGGKWLLEGMLGISNVSTNVWSAIIAVIALHVALGLFIHRAYFDSGKSKPKPDEKVD